MKLLPREETSGISQNNEYSSLEQIVLPLGASV